MGCEASTPKHRTAQIHNNFEDLETPREPVEVPIVYKPSSHYFPDDFTDIMQGVSKLPKPVNGRTQVVLSIDAMPLVVAPLIFDNGDSTNISLPIVSISRALKARISTICSFSLLVKSNPENTEASVFFENLTRWTSGGRKGSVSVCLLGIDSSTATILQRNMKGFGFKINVSERSVPEKTNVIITKSSHMFIQDIVDAIEEGIGIMIVNNDPEPLMLGPILDQAGIPFSNCTLKIGPSNSESIKTRGFIFVSQITLNTLIKGFLNLLESDDIDVSQLDNAVTVIRYHIVMVKEDEDEILAHLLTKTWEYVIKSGVVKEEKTLNPNLIQNILTVLVIDLIPKMPASFFEGKDHSEIFPGKKDEYTVDTYEVEITPRIGWVSTGLYLPPGVVSTVTSDTQINNAIIQIGSMSINSITKIPPWKRWPISVLYYSLNDTEIQIASPFGGIIYVLFDEEMNNFNLKITNVCKYPHFDLHQPAIWKETKDSKAPTTEIESQSCIFTIPSDLLDKIGDIQTFLQKYHRTVQLLKRYLGCEKSDPIRVAFDPDFNHDGQNPDYPIFLPISALDNLCNFETPTKDMFNMIKGFSKLLLPEDYFSDEVIELFSILATISTMEAQFPGSQPIVFTDNLLPPHYEVIAGVESQNHEAIPTAFYKIREFERAGVKPKKDMWPVFIQVLQESVHFDGKLILGNVARSASLSSFQQQASSASLQHFQIPDDEIERL